MMIISSQLDIFLVFFLFSFKNIHKQKFGKNEMVDYSRDLFLESFRKVKTRFEVSLLSNLKKEIISKRSCS